MASTRETSGSMTSYNRPVWLPLLCVVGHELAGWFMWMYELTLSDGTRVRAYKHIDTRRYLHIGQDGRTFEYTGGSRYREIALEAALDEAFDGWEESLTRRDRPERVREALECARRGYPRRMITRMWRGWTCAENAHAYAQFLHTELFPSMGSIDGFQGAEVLTRDEVDEVAFVTLTRFSSLDAIKAFAGEEYETPVLEPTARALLSRYDERAQHYESVEYPRGG